MLVKKVRPSELLKPHLDYYDRLPGTHRDRSYGWLCDTIEALLTHARTQRNMSSIVLDASGREQVPQTRPKNAMPAKRTDGVEGGGDGAPVPGGGGVAEVPKGGGRGDGRRRGGGGRGGGGADSQKVEFDAESVHSSALPHKSNRLCIKFLWDKCPDSADKCERGVHKIPDSIPPALRRHALFEKMLKEFGEPDLKS